MSKTKTANELRQILDEIRQSGGLPENISTEFQLWDEILKKEVHTMSEQLFPLIKEVHGKEYPAGTNITPIATEYSVERADTKKITSIRADIAVRIGDEDVYHLECEIDNDGTLILRMLEYDVHIALSYPIPDKDSNGRTFTIKFPYSTVLYLQDNRNTPDELVCNIQFQDGSTHQYRVPTVKVQSFSLEEVQQKHLNILIPFLPLRFRKCMKRDAETGKKVFTLAKEELTSFFNQIILTLEKEVSDGFLSEKNRNALLSLLHKSMIRVFYQDETLIKEVIDMTAPILELEIDPYIRENEALRQQNEAMLHEKLAIQQEKLAMQQENEAMQLQLADSREENAFLRAKIAEYEKRLLKATS